MHIFPARVLTPEAVWYPVTAEEDAVTHELHVDARRGEWRHALREVRVDLAPADVRKELQTERLWFVSGLDASGETQTWVVEYARGCGCGQTSAQEPNANQLALLDTATAYFAPV